MSRRTDSDMALAVLNRCRGKQSVTLDLKKLRAREIFFDLVRKADVVVENFSTGTADRLGVGYESVRAVNERIVYCSISGFGQDAQPGVRAMDAVIQALSGIMLASGAPEDPPIRVGVPIADGVSPLYAVIGILAVLRSREQTGIGEQVDVSDAGGAHLSCRHRGLGRARAPGPAGAHRPHLAGVSPPSGCSGARTVTWPSSPHRTR